MHLWLPLASGDNWIGLLVFIVIVVLSSISKRMQKGQEEPADELPRPQPPVMPPRPVRRPLSQHEVQEVLRRMRPPTEHGVPRHKPPVIQEPEEEEAPRRLVELQPEKPELPSGHPEQAPHATVIPSAHPEEVPHRTLLPSVHPEETPHAALPSALRKPMQAMTPGVATIARASAYRQQLRDRDDVRRAIVLREVLGPPVGLREDW